MRLRTIRFPRLRYKIGRTEAQRRQKEVEQACMELAAFHGACTFSMDHTFAKTRVVLKYPEEQLREMAWRDEL